MVIEIIVDESDKSSDEDRVLIEDSDYDSDCSEDLRHVIH